MMVSAAFAVTITARRRRQGPAMLWFGSVTLVLLYALVDNVVEKPDGIMISGLRPHCYFECQKVIRWRTCCGTCCSVRATPRR
jgi:hypothetical protein